MHPGKALIIPLLCAVHFNPGKQGSGAFLLFEAQGREYNLSLRLVLSVHARTHALFFAVFAHHLACQVSYPLKVQPGFPSRFALNKGRGSSYLLNPDTFLPSFCPLFEFLFEFLWSFPSGLASVLRNRKCNKYQGGVLAF